VRALKVLGEMDMHLQAFLTVLGGGGQGIMLSYTLDRFTPWWRKGTCGDSKTLARNL